MTMTILPTALNTAPVTPVNPVKPAIDSQGFLRLLITQLQHQDPLSPTDPGSTVLQLASLSQVSALQEISALLKQLLAAKDTRAQSLSQEADLEEAVPHEGQVPLRSCWGMTQSVSRRD